MWYTFFGAATTVTISLLVSKIFVDRDSKTVDLKLIAPIIRKYYAKDDVNQTKTATKESPQVFDESIL